MPTLDWLLILVICVGLWLGWKLRLVHLLALVISLVTAVAIANRYQTQMRGWFADPLVAWLVLFLGTVVSLAILSSLFAQVLQLERFRWLDHLAGAVMGLTVSLLLFLSVTLVISAIVPENWSPLRGSHLARPLLSGARPVLLALFEHIPSLRSTLEQHDLVP